MNNHETATILNYGNTFKFFPNVLGLNGLLVIRQYSLIIVIFNHSPGESFELYEKQESQSLTYKTLVNSIWALPCHNEF